MATKGYDYFIGPMYYWRYNRDTERVEIFKRPDGGEEFVWVDEDQFQAIYDMRWNRNVRYVSADVFFREGLAYPFAVKGRSVTEFNRKGK